MKRKKMSTAVKVDTKFKDANKLGKGRPIGSKNKTKSILDIIGTERMYEIINNLADKALAGDMTASRILIERLFPPAKVSTFVDAEHVSNVITQEDANDALTRIMNDVANAELSLEDADQLMNLIQKKVESTQICIQDKLDYLMETVNNTHKA